MNRARILELLTQNNAFLSERDGVAELALFGSIARGAARQDSAIDVLVRFDGPATSSWYFGVQFFREDLLGRPVDLVTQTALRAQLRPCIESQAVHV